MYRTCPQCHESFMLETRIFPGFKFQSHLFASTEFIISKTHCTELSKNITVSNNSEFMAFYINMRQINSDRSLLFQFFLTHLVSLLYPLQSI